MTDPKLRARVRYVIGPDGLLSGAAIAGPIGVVMDLGGWLRSLGLEQYEAAFRENAIDDTVLPTLTAEDLKDLGVRIVGHRRKLLNAIAALRTDASAKAPPPTRLRQPTSPSRTPPSAVRSR